MAKKRMYLVVLLVSVQYVYGYLDPGSISYFFQILIMAFIGGLVAIKTFWQSIKGFIKKMFTGKENQ